MPLHPQAEDFLEKMAGIAAPAVETLPVPVGRSGFESMRKLTGPTEPVAQVEDRTLADGVTLRVYRPEGPGLRPALVFVHGGGWVFGSLETVDGPCRTLANASDSVVVSVGYRRAPEHPFPAPLEDCYAALRYVAEDAESLGVNPEELAVGGDSAGGNLAAAVAMLARDRGGPRLGFQMLIYPALDASLDTDSYREFAKGYGLTKSTMAWYWGRYLADAEDRENPLACPSRARDLGGLPPAWILSAEYDPLRDEAEAYAARLREAGVAAQLRRYPGMIHGFFQMAGILDDGKKAILEAASALRDAWRR